MIHPAPSRWRWQVHRQVGSTQDEAIDAARTGQSGRLAILAEMQTAGRGSRGRGWVAPVGNLNLSVLLRPEGERPDPGRWAMRAGVALYEALRPFADGLMLKWPNDVLLRDAKIGGVLIDSAVRIDGRLDWVVIGFGANLAAAPQIQDRLSACLPHPAPSARHVARSVLSWLERFEGAELHRAWLSRAHGPGTEIDVVTPGRRITGRFAGLNSRGELLLQGDPRPVSSAEVFLRPCASAEPRTVFCDPSMRPL